MTSPCFSVLAKAAYFHDLANRIAKTAAGDSVTLVTMSFELSEPAVSKLMDLLCAAAKRGAHIHLLVDAYAFYAVPLAISEANWRKPPLATIRPSKIKHKLEALDKLATAGGIYTITNHPVSIVSHPFGGRSHIKFVLINDLIYLGGCNLDDVSYIDIMVRWSDKSTSFWLQRFAEKLRTNVNVMSAMNQTDISLPLGRQTKLLVDAGVPHQSIIFNEAVRLIDEAKRSVFITCQFYPGGRIAKPLIRALERGVKVTFIYNNPFKHTFPYNILFKTILRREARHLPRQLLASQLPLSCNFIHAKVIATEQGALVGSHNFVNAGVDLGTAECAILHNNHDFARQVVNSIERNMAELPTM